MPTGVKLPPIEQAAGSVPTLPSGAVVVRNADTGNPVSVYNDRALTSLASGTGATTVTQGKVAGYAASGVDITYTVTPSNSSQATLTTTAIPLVSSSVESGSGHADRSPFIDLTTGRYNNVDGDDITAELLDAITRYAPVANQTGLVIYMPGDFQLSAQIIFPAYISPVGAGSRTATRIKCMTTDAGFVVRSRGPKCGRFVIDAYNGNAGSPVYATQPFYTDGVNRDFEDIEVLNSGGDGVVVENAQNCRFDGLGINESADSALVLRNGASANKFDLLRVSGFNEYAVKQHQTVAQNAAYPNGLSGTILAGSPIHNKLVAPMLERLGSTVGGGTVGVGLGGVLCRGGSLFLQRPTLSIVPTTADTATITLDWDGLSTTNRVLIEEPQALGDLTRGIFCQIADSFASSRLFIRGGLGGEIQAYRTAYKLSDTAAVISDVSVNFYNNVTTRMENVGAGTKTYDNLVRSSRLEPLDWQRPNGGDQIFTTKRTSDASGYRAGMTADGVLYIGPASSFVLTSYPGLYAGNGSPEGVVSARIGSTYFQLDATSAGSALWTKASGTGVTGWVQGVATSAQTVATDANFTVANGGPEITLVNGTAYTARRTGTLNALTAPGQRRRIVRLSGGGFNLDILNKTGGLVIKSLMPGEWADFEWDGADWQPQASGMVWGSGNNVADIRSFGAIGDGTAHLLSERYGTLGAAQAVYPLVTSLTQSIDWAAITKAIEYVGVRGGGRVLVSDTGADYVLVAADAVTAGSNVAYFNIRHSNVIIEGGGAGSSGIRADATSSAAAIFWFFKGDSRFDTGWATKRWQNQTVYTLSGSYTAGQQSVTTTTAADAGNFAAGDYIYIRTGNLIAGTTEPDAEVNVVETATAGTGVITLRYPLVKPYQAENFVSGSSGKTAVGGAGTAAPYGVAKVTSRTLVNVGFRNLNATNADTGRGIINGEGIFGYTVQGCDFTSAVYGASQGSLRFVKHFDNTFRCTGTGTWTYIFSYATGSSDIEARGNSATSLGRMVYWHVHEGVANWNIHHNRVINPAGMSANENAASIRARSYNGRLTDNVFHNASSGGATVTVDLDCVAGGEIDGNLFSGSQPTNVINVSTGATGWRIGPRNKYPAGTSTQTAGTNQQQPEQTFNLVGWVNAADAGSLTLGIIPAFSAVIEIDLFHVSVAFNGTTPTVALGISGLTSAYATATAVDTTGAKTPTLGTSARQYTTTERTLIATIAGTSVTTGKLLVSVRCQRVPVIP